MTQAEQSVNSIKKLDTGATENVLLSHDIRSAVARIFSASQLLETAALDAEAQAQVGLIKTASLYINDLLAQALVAPDMAPETVPVTELKPALAQLETTWAGAAKQKSVGFSVDRACAIPGALHLPQLDFFRILNNIIGNALKFTGSGALQLRLSRTAHGALEFAVADDGPGFSEAALARLFSRHGRPESNTEHGSGFGLYIARTLVERAGGEICATNRPGGGALVSVSFPEDLLIAAAKPVSPPLRPKAGLPDLSHLRVLLAEDNPTNQLVATQMLKKMNANVEVASDGVEALARLDTGKFNLGLIDIEMPRKSGLEVMREMRARGDEKAATTLLALTAYVLPEHRERITKAGADGIIAKPLTDVAAFGNAILIYTGERAAPAPPPPEINPDADIQMDIYTGLKEIIGHESMQELLGKVKSDLQDVRDGVLAGVAASDVTPIRAQTHILISVAGAVGAVNLQHIAETLNATAKTGDWAKITQESMRCEKGIASVLTFVENELGNG